jgi:hypothetical protein
MATNSVQKIVVTVCFIFFVVVAMTSCSDTSSSSDRATRMDLSFPVQMSLANSNAVIDSLQAYVTIDGGNPYQLTVDPTTSQVSGTISGVSAGDHDLVITYYVESPQGSGEEVILATCSNTVTVIAGQAAEVAVTDDDLNRDYDDDNDGVTNLDEVRTGTDPLDPNSYVVSIDVTPTNPSIGVDTTQQFTATGTFSDQSTQDFTAQFVWSSSDSGVATVSNDTETEGLATGVAVGSTTISASLGSISGSAELTVTSVELESIAVTPTNPSIGVETTQQFTATGTFSDQSNQELTTQVTWASSDNDVATVSNAAGSEGLATSVMEGSTTISASYEGTSGSTVLTVSGAAPTCEDNPCDGHATCDDSTGTVTCTCNQGWTGDGFSCSDINECSNGDNECSPYAECSNDPGTYSCECDLGFSGDGLGIEGCCRDDNTLIVSGNTVYDPDTGLTWNRYFTAESYNWSQAEDRCNLLGLRLATRDELATILDDRFEPAFMPCTFRWDDDSNLSVWSSTLVGTQSAFIAHFGFGGVGNDVVYNRYGLMCVSD